MLRWIIFLDSLSRSFSYHFCYLVVIFSRPRTSHAGVLKMPRVSNEYGVFSRSQNMNENDSEISSSLLAFIQILDSSHCKFLRLARIGWSDGWFFKLNQNIFFSKVLLKVHHYPAYYIMAEWPDWTFYDVIFIIYCTRERVLRSSWILNECNLSCKIILLKTAEF